jgi:EAL domain-containing protein (putative c-di-GMP-specific phosphodiesterase class I)
MYQAKEGGLASVLYASDADPNSRERLQLAGELRAAFPAGEIVLHYQPKVSLATGQVTGVEALVRWQHPRRGLLSPREILPVADRSGLMRRLTRHVLEQALAQAGAWSGEGIDLRVAVNLSVSDLLDESLPDLIVTLLKRYGVDGTRLQLEVTENIMLTAPEHVAEIVVRLAYHGVTLSLDDFGVGYSSLAHLRGLMVDELKIDRLFVTNIATNAFDDAVVRSTVDLAHSLGLRVVAEGVETAETLDELRAKGCDEAQGDYIRRPGPADQLTPWLRRRLGIVLNAP